MADDHRAARGTSGSATTPVRNPPPAVTEARSAPAGTSGAPTVELGATPPSLIGRALGQYRILEKIGQGGMGCVFRAEDTALKRPVALKVLVSGILDNVKTAERFQREARCLARLSHPNLLHVYNVGVAGDLHYFAMELLDGTTLFARIREGGRLPAGEALPLAGQILSALHYMHRQGVTHRDVKSGNIMVCGDRAVLMDFGLAKEEQATGLTSAGAVLGTPEYMAPEQAEALPCGPATDIYSFGVVLFEALTGQVPFTGRSALSIIRQHLDVPAPALHTRLPDADPRLDAALARCLAKQPGERYRDCAALAVDLVPLCPTPELAQLARSDPARPAADRTRPDFLAVAGEETVPLTPAVPKPARPPRWVWVALGFAGMLVLGLILLRQLRPRDSRPGLAPLPGQVVRVESGPRQGQEIRWEFHGGVERANWSYQVQLRLPDGSWGEPQKYNPEEFLKEFPRLRFSHSEGTAPP